MLDVWTESAINHLYIIFRISCKDDICIDFFDYILSRGNFISRHLESSIGGSGELFCGRNFCLARGMQSLEDE